MRSSSNAWAERDTVTESLDGLFGPEDPKSVLIVDDSKMMRTVVQEILQPLGHMVLQASNGEEAIDLARLRRPDLILLDWFMPGLDGLGVLKGLRSTPETRDIPVCLLTVSKDPEVLRGAVEYGVTDYLSKPANPNRLREKVRKYLG